jgi:hypothetical protein
VAIAGVEVVTDWAKAVAGTNDSATAAPSALRIKSSFTAFLFEISV